MCNLIIPNIPDEILASIITVIWALLSVYSWFYYWKKQVKGQKEYELALIFLESLHSYKNILQLVRDKEWNPEWIKTNIIYKDRQDKLLEIRNEMEKKEITLKLLLEDKIEKQLNEELEKILDQEKVLQINIKRYVDNKEKAISWDTDILFWSFDDTDIFDMKIKKSIENIHLILKLNIYLLK